MLSNKVKRLKVLITAHELSPKVGSECSSGWNVITRLGGYHDVTVLFAEKNQFGTNNYKEQIDEYISLYGSIRGIEFIAIAQPFITNKIAAINKTLSDKRTSIGVSFLYFLGLRFWEKEILIKAKELIKERHFDLIHHFNHLSFREPGYLWKLDKPFFWGPASGLSRVPNSFLVTLPFTELLYNLLRNLLNQIQVSLSGRIWKAIKKSSLIYFVTKDDEIFFSKRHKNISNLLDIGSIYNGKLATKILHNGRVRILWVGRFSFLKALDILLYAIGRSEILRSQLELCVIGDGPQKEYYKNIANILHLENIQWVGSISKDEVQTKMSEADFLVHSSIKEAASAVILESLSAGLPVICHDAFGMSFAIDETCGIKIPFVSPEESIVGFKKALEGICLNRNQIVELGEGASERAKHLTWDSISEKIANDYNTINGSRQTTNINSRT